MSSRPARICLGCKRPRPHHARGLCPPCYQRARKADLGIYPAPPLLDCAGGCGGKVPREGVDLCAPCFCASIGLTYRQLDYWARQGYLRPQGGTSSGRPRVWDPAEVEVARRMARLIAAGLPLAWSAGFARTQWPEGELATGIRVRVEAALAVSQ